MVRRVLAAVLVPVGLAGALMIVSPWLAERMLFLPGRLPDGPPPAAAGVRAEDIRLVAADGTVLHAWWFEAGPGAPALVHFHGNAGHIGDRLYVPAAFLPRGLSVLLLSYRGYGRSEGVPTEAGLYLDGAAAVEYAAARAGGTQRIALFGHSLGGAIAAHAAVDANVAALVLESAFTSLDAIARTVYPFLPGFLFRRLRGHFDTRAAVARLQAPVLVIHGERDGIVPVAMGRAIHETAGARSEWLPLPGADHNDVAWVGGAAYADRIASFVHAAVRASAGGT